MAESGVSYVRLRLHNDGGTLSVVGAKEVSGPLTIPDYVSTGLIYEVLVENRRIGLGSLPGPNVRRAAHNQGNPDAAQAAYDHLWRGSAAFSGGRFDEAESHLQAAAQINPNSYEAANNLGTIYQLRGEIDRAISCYRKALEKRSNGTYVPPEG